MSNDTALLVVTKLNKKTGDVTLQEVDPIEVPATVIWHYGAGCELEDRIGTEYLVTFRKVEA